MCTSHCNIQCSLSPPPQRFVKDDAQWAGFRSKLAKWLCLCDIFPYRMSFLVLVVTDRAQKQQVNRQRHMHPLLDKYGLVHYGMGGGNAIVLDTSPDTTDESLKGEVGGEADIKEPGLELPDDMPIAEAYFRHVERYIYSHPKARKMLSLDGDSVRAAFSLSVPSWILMLGLLQYPRKLAFGVCAGRSSLLRCSCNRWLTWARQILRRQRPATSPWATFSAP